MEFKYKENDKLQGFVCTRAREIKEQNGILYEFLHPETGARLLWMQNSDTNKLFSVSFRTGAEDSTGVFHILEHSVLCGSEKYPVREPFVELLKSSMNTFLNAMTFPDKTMYPVSSRNEKDFLNLTSVYLDAVFKPALYTNPNIFYQEGWHYEYREGDSVPVFKGVVFNEMKGSESNVDNRIEKNLLSLLFPDTCYRHNSGGDPKCIPSLTYEEFVRRHGRFYNPSNAIFYLEGDIDPQKPVSLIMEYLEGRENSGEDTEIKKQEKVSASRMVSTYPVTPSSPTEGMSRIMMGKILCDFSDKQKVTAADILCSFLADSNSSPLVKPFVESGLAQDVSLNVNDGVRQPYITIQFINTSPEKEEEIKRVLNEAVDGLVKDGIDAKNLEAEISSKEFTARDLREPRSLIHNIMALNSMLYGGDPALYLEYDEVFKTLRDKLGTDYWTTLLSEMFSDLSVVVLNPSETMAEEEKAEEDERLVQISSYWSDEDKEKYLDINRKLDAWQGTPDTPEQLSTMPKLKLSDVEPLPFEHKMNVSEYGPVTLLTHPSDISGITYISLLFPVDEKYAGELQKAALMCELYQKVPAAGKTLQQLLSQVKRNTGSLVTSLEAFPVKNNPSAAKLCVSVSMSALEEKIPEAVDTMLEILLSSEFTDKENIRNCLLQLQEGARNAIMMSGHAFGLKRAAVGTSCYNNATDLTEGIGFYEYVKQFNSDFDRFYNEFLEFTGNFIADTLTKNGLIYSVALSAQQESENDIASKYGLVRVAGRLPDGIEKKTEMNIPGEKKNTFVQIPAPISYACMAADVTEGENLHGSSKVASNIVSLDYLWNELRVKGGAYGAGMPMPMVNGIIRFYSYRDPNPVNSFSTYMNCGEYLNKFAENTAGFDSYIISTIGNTEPLQSPKDEADDAMKKYLMGITYEERYTSRKEVLGTTAENLKECAEKFTPEIEKCGRCLLSMTADGFDADETIVL